MFQAIDSISDSISESESISVSENNKCPICRAALEGDSDDEDDEIFDGNNDRPTIDLFESRRWLNVETNKIEYFFIYDNVFMYIIIFFKSILLFLY